MAAAEPNFAVIFLGGLLCGSAGYISAWSDCHNEIERLNVRTLSIAFYPLCMLFYAFNSVIAIGFYIWAVVDPDAWINKAVGAENLVYKGILIGLAVTALSRSSVGTVRNKKVGLVHAYDVLRMRVLEVLLTDSTDAKETIIDEYSGKFITHATFPDELESYVLTITQLREGTFQSKISRAFKKLKGTHGGDPTKVSIYHRRVIKVALDYGGISPVRRWLSRRREVRN